MKRTLKHNWCTRLRGGQCVPAARYKWRTNACATYFIRILCAVRTSKHNYAHASRLVSFHVFRAFCLSSFVHIFLPVRRSLFIFSNMEKIWARTMITYSKDGFQNMTILRKPFSKCQCYVVADMHELLCSRCMGSRCCSFIKHSARICRYNFRFFSFLECKTN